MIQTIDTDLRGRSLSDMREHPDLPTGDSRYRVIGPVDALSDGEGSETVFPFTSGLIQEKTPFILHVSSHEDGEISWIWDGEGEEPYKVEGWQDDPSTNIPPFITCKWYAPSQMRMGYSDIIAFSDDYPYDKGYPTLNACGNPDMGVACGSEACHPQCVGYSPDPVKIPVHLRSSTGREIIVETSRTGAGARTVQTIELNEEGETTITDSQIVSAEALSRIIEAVKKDAAAADEAMEEVAHQSSRKSFLKGLIPS